MNESPASALHNNDNPTRSNRLTPLLKRIQLPKFEKWRKPIKISFAMLVAIIMTLSERCRESIGQGTLLVCITLSFYFPSRAFGVVFEDVVFGTMGGLIASAYSFLAMFTADLARDPNNPVAVQPKSSGVLAVYFFLGVFTFSAVRLHVPKATFGCINGMIIMAFTMTESSVIRGFHPSLVWSFMKPIAVGGGIALAVAALIWPDDSVSNYMGLLSKALEGHNTFFKEHAEGFLSLSQTTLDTTLPSLHDRLQSRNLILIDCKRAVHRDILYSQLNGKDISQITRIIKEMRNPLHGIGVSQILKQEFFSRENEKKAAEVLENTGTEKDVRHEQEALLSAIAEIQPIFQQMVDGLYGAMEDCISRFQMLHAVPDRSNWGSLLWPFPRIIYFRRKIPAQPKKPLNNIGSSQLLDLVTECESAVDKKMANMLKTHWETPLRRHYGGMHLVALHRFCLKEYGNSVIQLLGFVEQVEVTREQRCLWLPTPKSLRKWLWDTQNTWSATEADRAGESDDQEGNDDPTELTLTRTHTRREHELNYNIPEDGDPTCGGGAFVVASGKRYQRDPDVDPPVNRLQSFFYGLFRIRQWLREPLTFTALKTAIGTVVLASPVFLAGSAGWFMAWRGQWAVIIMMLWMIPSTGMFLYTILMRTLGTAAGGVLGIIVWEIAQGNPYGLGVVMFIAMVLLYYVLMYRPSLRMFCILTIITMLLVVIYEYQYAVGVQAGDEKVWVVAGKRMLLVAIGVFAAGVLSMIPEPNVGRVELRKRLAQTLRDIGRLYGILTSQFIVINNMNGFHPTEEQAKGFRRMGLNIRRQIADERAFLKHARFEPPMRGRFPAESYKIVLEKVDNMADLVTDMGYALRDLSPVWRQQIASTLTMERRDYLASIMTTIKLLSATLAAKMALPPYMIAPGEARNRFVRSLDRKIHVLPDDLVNPSFLRYSTYIVTSGTFVQELSALLDTVEDLVGVEDPQEWLRLHV